MHPFAKAGTEIDVERYTPPEIAAAVRETLGDIDLDPCTTAIVNRTFIRAKRFYTRESDGLDRENNLWKGRVYVNPPSYIERGENSQRNSPQLFWERLIVEYESKQVSAGVFLAFNLEHLQQSQNWNRTMLQYPFCIPAKRLTFWREKGGRLESRDHAEFASAVIYVGRNIKRFTNAFENIGTVVIPRIANKQNIPKPKGVSIEELIENPPPPSARLQKLLQTKKNEACRIATEADKRLLADALTPIEDRERFGIHCAIDADPDIDMPLQEPNIPQNNR